jgi:hypothetical protein
VTTPALPYSEAAPLADVYADAASLAATYPVSHLPHPVRADLDATERGWHRLTDDITAEADLGDLYGD